jgi:hypothetical protein
MLAMANNNITRSGPSVLCLFVNPSHQYGHVD